jgi:hypothetical protein
MWNRLWAGYLRDRGSIPGGNQRSRALDSAHTGYGAHPSSNQMDAVAFS